MESRALVGRRDRQTAAFSLKSIMKGLHRAIIMKNQHT